jgi:ketosteroid isomerase-like protein
MKIRLLIALTGLAISFDLPSFGQQKDTAADSQTTQKIQAIGKAYDEAVNNNDAAAIAALYAEDAVFVSTRGIIHGRQAIEKWYADVFQRWHPKNHIGKPDGAPHIIGMAGNEAWVTGEWSETGQGKTGDPVQIKGYWSAIDSREGDDWKIRMLTYNLTPAPPATEAATPSPK